MFLGVCVSSALGMGWIFAREAWQETDPSDPRKVFAQEIFKTVKAELHRDAQNGSGLGRLKTKLLRRPILRTSRPEQGRRGL
jgi:hypothetical protein